MIEFSDDSGGSTRVLSSPGLRRLTFHVLEANAVTLLIARSLGLSLGSSVRYLEDLTSFGVPDTHREAPAPDTVFGVVAA